jgi:hypothetical protein
MKRFRIILVTILWIIVGFDQLNEANIVRDPPRALRNLDYLLMILVPFGSFVLAQSDRSWRYYLWIGMVSALPFSINVLSKAIQQVRHYEPVWAPALAIFIGLSCASIVAGLIGKGLMTFIQNRKQSQQLAGG